MADYSLYVPFVLKWEGGYVNDPVDRGGETNMGITRTTFNSLAPVVLGIQPTETAFLSLTRSQASEFVRYFWDKATYNNSVYDQAVAEAMTSWFWGSGYVGLREIQRLLNERFNKNLDVDGVIGPKTVDAVNSINPSVLFSAMLERREEFFRELAENDPSQTRFLQGWLNRLDDFSSRHKKKF